MKIFQRIKRIITRFLLIVLTLSISIGIILFFRWVGWRGLLGFAVGVLVTGYIFMSNHPFIKVWREMNIKNG